MGPSVNVVGAEGGLAILAGLAGVIGIFTTVFWMYVAWRAMQAHERLSDAIAKHLRELRETK